MLGAFRRRRSEQDRTTVGVPSVPDDARKAAGITGRERLLAGAQDDDTGAWVLVTSWRLVAVADGTVSIDRPWMDVDGGSWEPEAATLSLSWVGEGEGQQWRFLDRTGPGRIPEAFRERVSASVVLQEHLNLGDRRSARVVIREDLRTRELVEQVLLGPRTSLADPEISGQIAVARAHLRDQVALPPPAPDEEA